MGLGEWWNRVQGKSRIPEARAALESGRPSPEVLERILAMATYTMSEDRLRNYRDSAWWRELSPLPRRLAYGKNSRGYTGSQSRIRRHMAFSGKRRPSSMILRLNLDLPCSRSMNTIGNS